jgi:tetratricopeptide (TPR) repeat protein
MTSAPDSGTDDTLDDVAARLCDDTPGLILLRYRDARVPALLEDAIRLRCPGARTVCIPYRPGAWEGTDGSVSQVVAAACREAAGPVPAIVLLFPDFNGSEPRDPAQVPGFWKRLNSQREVLGSLHARVLVGISPDDDPFAHHHAMDLLSWCMPKFEIHAMHEPMAREAGVAHGSSERLMAHDGPSDADRLRHVALAPLWKEIVSSKIPLTAEQVEGVGLPLLDAVLDEGIVGEAESILAAMEQGSWPPQLRALLFRARGRLHQLKGHQDEALNVFHRALALHDELLRANPADARTASAMCCTLDDLAEAMVMRGQAGDATRALGYYERSLKVREDLLAANPHSAQAARDVLVSLERMAKVTGTQPGFEAAQRALGLQQRSLDIALGLRKANPESAFHARTAAIAFFLAAERAQAAGKEELAHGYRSGCLTVLHEMITAGCQIDPSLMELYQQLEAARQGSASTTAP